MLQPAAADITMQVSLIGENGDGLGHAAGSLGRLFARQFHRVVSWRDRPARIRGGEAAHTIRGLETADAFGLADEDDVRIYLERSSSFKVVERGWTRIVCLDSQTNPLWPCPADAAAEGAAQGPGAPSKDRAMFAAGIAACLAGLHPSVVQAAEVGFSLRAGYDHASMFLKPPVPREEVKTAFGDRAVAYLSGNEMVAAAALAAGCRFVAAYPITPATEIFERMQERMPSVSGHAVLAEDEHAAASMAIGAAYAGARAMTVTSGPGMSLMTESLGYASMIEVPLVIVHCSRGGPSTGMPTRQEQSDVNHLVFGGHGEFPRVVLTPGTAQEAFVDTLSAFDIADRYQCPVIVLLDQMLAVDRTAVDLQSIRATTPDRGAHILDGEVAADYRRFDGIVRGVSPRAIPSVKNGMHISSGSEHDEHGRPNDTAPNRTRMVTRRLEKSRRVAASVIGIQTFGDVTAGVLVVAFGSSVGPALEARCQLQATGLVVAVVQLRTLCPFPADDLTSHIRGAQKVFVVEQNATGQVRQLVAALNLGVALVQVGQADGRPFRPASIANAIRSHMGLEA